MRGNKLTHALQLYTCNADIEICKINVTPSQQEIIWNCPSKESGVYFLSNMNASSVLGQIHYQPFTRILHPLWRK